jgi:hypothetical protein
VAVAVIATVMALSNIASHEVVREMNLTASEVNNAWAYFQSKSLKQHLAENARDLLTAQSELAGVGASGARARVDRYASEVQRYQREKDQIQHEAEALEARRSHLQARNARFEAGEAAFSLSLALLGLTALTQRRGLLVLGLVFACLGLGASLTGEFSLGLPAPVAHPSGEA